jgi:hypothetical protein
VPVAMVARCSIRSWLSHVSSTFISLLASHSPHLFLIQPLKMAGSPHTSSDLNEKADQTNISPLEDEDEFIIDKAMEKRLNWKCDIKLLPPLICLFVITFVDRTNIANAKIEGMTTDLKMKGNDYNTSLWILNIPYICLAVPSNLLMKKGFVRPAVYLSGIMFCWGEIFFYVYGCP